MRAWATLCSRRGLDVPLQGALGGLACPLLAEGAQSLRAALICINFYIINFNVVYACLMLRITLHTPD